MKRPFEPDADDLGLGHRPKALATRYADHSGGLFQLTYEAYTTQDSKCFTTGRQGKSALLRRETCLSSSELERLRCQRSARPRTTRQRRSICVDSLPSNRTTHALHSLVSSGSWNI